MMNMRCCGVCYDLNVYPGVIQILLWEFFITPPGANNIAMKDHLKSSLELIETLYPNSGIILADDFNQLDFT